MTNITKKDSNESTALGLPFTEPRKKKLLQLLAKHGNLNRAAAEVGVSYTTVTNHMSKEPFFKELVEASRMQYMGKIEDAMFQRAVEGEEEDVWYQGEVVGKKLVKSDRLLEVLAKANDAKYQAKGTTNNTLVVDGSGGIVSALEKFLGVEDKPKESAQEDADEDIIDGEYDDTTSKE